MYDREKTEKILEKKYHLEKISDWVICMIEKNKESRKY